MELETKAAIAAIASYLPEGRLTNETLASELGAWSAGDILQKTGIAERRIAAADECASDLGVAAAQKLFASGACKPEDVDYLLFCTQSPDYFLPATACLVQDRLGLRTGIGAIDFNQGCSGYVYGLSLAKALIETGQARHVLLITAETYSKYINRRDRSVRTLFGDAAAATLVRGVESDRELLGPFVFGTDGRGADNLIVATGAARRLRTPESAEEVEEKGSWRSRDNLYMNGAEIFNFTLKAVPAAVHELLARSGRESDSVDYFIFHQANRFMLDRLRAKLGIDVARFCIELESCGNTVSSTIPIALERAALPAGKDVMLVGFGVGYSWAAAMMRTV
jgi:3-oxoacyl-[acyl-carrier-protein] synthase-3